MAKVTKKQQAAINEQLNDNRNIVLFIGAIVFLTGVLFAIANFTPAM